MKSSVWINLCVFALFGSLLATPIRKLHRLILEFDHEELNENIKCLPSSKFYTPTNVEPECITAAINCSFLEFSQVVKSECGDPNEILNRNLEVLELINNHLKVDNVENGANGCACETWAQTSFGEFLTNHETLLQLLESAQYSNDRGA